MRAAAGSTAAPAAKRRTVRRGTVRANFMSPSPWMRLSVRALLRLRSGGSQIERSLLLELQLLDHALLLRDLLHRECVVLIAAQIETLLVELRHRGEVRRLVEPLFEGIVQDLDDLRVHALWPADAIRRVRDDVDADLPQGRHRRPVLR